MHASAANTQIIGSSVGGAKVHNMIRANASDIKSDMSQRAYSTGVRQSQATTTSASKKGKNMMLVPKNYMRKKKTITTSTNVSNNMTVQSFLQLSKNFKTMNMSQNTADLKGANERKSVTGSS